MLTLPVATTSQERLHTFAHNMLRSAAQREGNGCGRRQPNTPLSEVLSRYPVVDKSFGCVVVMVVFVAPFTRQTPLPPVGLRGLHHEAKDFYAAQLVLQAGVGVSSGVRPLRLDQHGKGHSFLRMVRDRPTKALVHLQESRCLQQCSVSYSRYQTSL